MSPMHASTPERSVGHPTVAAIWHLALPAGARLVGGESGLQQQVEWVTSLRAAFPMFGDLGPGYLALARMDLLRRLDARITLPYLIQELSRAAAVGLVVDGEVSETDSALADELAFPVFSVPAGTDLRETERDILRALVDLEGQLARREMQARELLQRVYGADGLTALLAQLAQITGSEVSLLDSAGVSLGRANVAAGSGEAAAGEVAEQVYPVTVGGRALGRLTLRIPPTRDTALASLYARQTAEICGIEVLQQLTRRETEERLGADLIEQILDPDADLEAVGARLTRLGYDASPGRYHLALAFLPAAGDPAAGDPAATALCERLAQDLRWAAERDRANVLVVRYREGSLCLCSSAAALPEPRTRRWLREALASLRAPDGRLPGGQAEACTVGVSRPLADLGALRAGVLQALDAASLGQRIADRHSPYYYDELGLYRLLVGLSSQDELQRFYRETLGILAHYDEAHNTELVRSLEVFFERNANASETARALYVHRNTLNYRLQRIVEITGLDLNDAEARLAFQLALKIRSLGAE
ncbi:MAG: helix-turn-helix domain-containing protein [Anaerolineae bacterium]|nr:helix-turn-helix domain-containing protein [Anaerolineae bacterium]